MTKTNEDPDSLPARGVSRRDVGLRAALLAVAGAARPVIGGAQDNRNPDPLPAGEQAEVYAKFASIIRKYGDRLSEDQRTRIRDVLARHERMLHRIRAFPLENSDSAATGLRLYPTDTAPASRQKKE